MPLLRRLPASVLETWSPTAASISCRTTRRWWFRPHLRRPTPRPTPRGATRRESLSPVYPAAGSHLLADGRHPVGRHGWLYTTAGLRAAGSGLSNYSGAHVLSW